MDPSAVEFRAGRLYLNGKKLEASTTKGLLRVASRMMGGAKVDWTLRGDGKDEPLSLVVEQAGGEYKHIKGAPGGRVFMLQLAGEGGRHFFWMQEPASTADQDMALMARINALIASPPSVVEAPPSPPQAAGAPGRLRIEDLQQILSGLPQQPVQQQQVGLTAGLDLSEVLAGDTLGPLMLSMPEEELAKLREFLPEEHTTSFDVATMVSSPQFMQAVDQFNAALHSNDLPSIWTQCGLAWNPAAMHGSVVECFLRAIAALHASE